jgi:subtilisin family serine protease
MSEHRFELRLQDLAAVRGGGVTVAVIDSGIHAAHPHVQGVARGIGIDPAGHEVAEWVDRLGHGTAVAAVIREKAPEAELIAIKVFDRDLRTTGAALVAALRWARNARVRLINLSLGTDNAAYESLLAEEVRACRADDVDIVAAGPQTNVRWLPGGLAGVVAVELDMALPRDTVRVSLDPSGHLVVAASGYPRPIPGVPVERNLKGLSFAVANATGLLARLLTGHPGASLAAALGTVRSTSPSA